MNWEEQTLQNDFSLMYHRVIHTVSGNVACKFEELVFWNYVGNTVVMIVVIFFRTMQNFLLILPFPSVGVKYVIWQKQDL